MKSPRPHLLLPAPAGAPHNRRVGGKPKTIDDCLAKQPADRRAALGKPRTIMHAIVPVAEGCISYSMPAFRVGRPRRPGFQATSNGCSYYPFSGRTLATLAAALSDYDHTKSALHFDPKRPLPKALARELLEARLAE